MLKLLIDVSGGIAGDMFAAALLSVGADFELVRAAMLQAAAKLGSAQISSVETSDGSTQLKIELQSNRAHLRGSEAREILADLFDEFAVKEEYSTFGLKALEILLAAEIRAHREYNIVIEEDSAHSHHHNRQHNNAHHHKQNHDQKPHHSHNHDSNHDHNQKHNHNHHHGEDSFLHEAQDIVIDIIGAVLGLQDLSIEPRARLLTPVSVGGGTVKCSHGILPVPAPAAQIILDRYGIARQKGPIETELSTPTGMSILAALGVQKPVPAALEDKKIVSTGQSRGTKVLDIPPLKIYLTG
ncbi:MAG: DUF111 family protein [Candidatus Aminicenantes bacterium]|nr:DUF111 family protein [Candidatus Aminicenantes bacterium]